MNNFPPQLPSPQQSGGYNPFNPYQGYDPNLDYAPWLPGGRQNPRWLPIAIIVGAVLLCSCCAFLVGIVVGIELPSFLAPSDNSQQNQNDNTGDPSNQDGSNSEDGSFHWRVVYPNA